ncbi:uncharacterized protein [Asterias amurensis]|uniref:uncharacterized protein n=1 Tax=Asterias amurensis TaxID=7602 RepID=UPI003AB2A99B
MSSVENICTRLPPVGFVKKKSNSKLVEADLGGIHEGHVGQLTVKCVPVILEFRRLFKSTKFKSVNVIPGIPNQELLHGIIALYDVCLPDITPEVLYFTVCGKWAKTLLLIRDATDVAEELVYSRKKIDQNANKSNGSEGTDVLTENTMTPDLDQVDNEAEGKGQTHIPSNCQKSANNLDSTKEKTAKEESDVDRQNTSGEKHIDEWVAKETSAAQDEVQGVTNDALAAKDEGEKKGIFADVFSDTDSENESESDEDEDDFTEGQEEFLKIVRQRRERRKVALSQGDDPSLAIGIESRLIACTTWEKSTIRPGERILQLDLLAVRKRFRKLGIGKYLLQNLKDPSLVGLYDAFVVYADHSAVDFFGHYGFNDDIVLNSKFSDLADNWTNCTLMCYLPPFSGQTILMETDPELDLKVMELELHKCSEKSRDAYQAQMACAMKLKHEVISLRALVSSQQDLITSLTQEFQTLRTERFQVEKAYLKKQLNDLKLGIEMKAENGNDTLINQDDDDDDDEVDTDMLLRVLESKVSSLGMTDSSRAESKIHWQVAEEFKLSMDDSVMAGMCVVSQTTKAHVSSSVVEMYKTRCSHLLDSSIHTKMYLCGTLEHPERIQRILSDGFTEQDFSHGEFGVGLYFSQHASKAAHFSALGKLLLVDIGLGKTESVIKKDNTRTAPPEGFDSIVTPGRLSNLSGGDLMTCGYQEYVIFDPYQALPLYLIEYRLE